MLLTKPLSCSGCPLLDGPYGKRVGYVPSSGTGENGVLIVLEAAGAEEEEIGVPVVGAAGLALFQQLHRVGIEREGFLVHNTLSCFTNPRTSVLTSEGYREISKLKVGDLVLTHNGRFRPITATHFLPKLVLPHYIVKLSDGTQHGVTAGHGWILVDGSVVLTENLKIGMKVPGLCEPCTQCGKQFHRKFKKTKPFCSRKCFNTFIARRSGDKIRIAMKQQYANGVRDPFAITKSANETVRKYAKEGTWAEPSIGKRTEAGKRAHRIKSAITRQALAHDTAGLWIGNGEAQLLDVLTAAGYESTPQFALEGFNYDFKVGDVLVEVDNPARDCQTVVKNRRAEKEALAILHGFSVIHVPSDNVGIVLDLLRNDTHDYEFVPVEVVSIERSKDRSGVWSCEVEEDESYVVKGIAHHNCRPPDNKLAGMPYEQQAILHCAPNLDQTIEHLHEVCHTTGKHPVIVTLGKIAFMRVLGLEYKSPILRQAYIAYPHWSEKYQCWVFAADHPAYLLRGNTQLWPVLQFVVQRALEVARDGLLIEKHDYLLDPEPGQFSVWVREALQAWGRDPTLVLSTDIETPYKRKTDEQDLGKEEDQDHTILRVSFCYRPNQAVSVRWSAEYLAGIEELMSSGMPILGWNFDLYDRPRIKSQVKILGPTIDGMVAWHVLNSSLKKGLGFVTPFYVQTTLMWKHLSESEPAYYNACDADMALRDYLSIRRDLENSQLLTVFDRHVLRLNKALDYMTETGVLRDSVMRDEAEQKLAGMLQEISGGMELAVPDTARALKILKREPKSTDGFHQTVRVYPVKYCGVCGLQKPTKTHAKLCPEWHVVTQDEPMTVWAQPLEFKLSKLSMGKYQKVVGHQPVVVRKGRAEPRVTYDEDAIVRLMKQYPHDPLYPKIIDFRKTQKLLSNYVGVTVDGRMYGGMQVGRDGRIHTTYTHSPSTLRFASEDPNLQNLPRPTKNPDDLSNIIRNLIVAGPGHTLTATDFAGIEAVLVGYFALDAKYVRLAKQDVHTFYTVHAIHGLDGRVKACDLPDINWPDDRLFPYLAELKKVYGHERNSLYKHLVHAINFQQSAKGAQAKIFSETRVEYQLKTISRVMDIYKELFPLIPRWHTATLEEADKEGFLRNPFNYVHRFSRVLERKKEYGEWTKSPGPDANRAIAFKPQSTAAAIIKEALMRLYYDRFDEAGQYLRLQVHDELLSECPTALVDNVRSVMEEEMSKPVPELRLPASWGMGEFLSINVESKTGSRWGSMR